MENGIERSEWRRRRRRFRERTPERNEVEVGRRQAEEKGGGFGSGVAEGVEEREMGVRDERGPVLGHGFESNQRLHGGAKEDLAQGIVVSGDCVG